MTTSVAGSLRTLPAMKPQMTHDQRIRREPGSLLKASGGTKCVVIACTAASQCTRRYTHDLEKQRSPAGFVSLGVDEPNQAAAHNVLFGMAQAELLALLR
jgi:hypothetical protein